MLDTYLLYIVSKWKLVFFAHNPEVINADVRVCDVTICKPLISSMCIYMYSNTTLAFEATLHMKMYLYEQHDKGYVDEINR